MGFLYAGRKTGLASIFCPKAPPVNGRKGPAIGGKVGQAKVPLRKTAAALPKAKDGRQTLAPFLFFCISV
jgi:hypothetical protein